MTEDQDKLDKVYDIAKRQTNTYRVIVISCCVVALVCIYYGADLIIQGAKGAFEFAMEFKGFKGYCASLAPGVLFLFLAGFVVWAGTRKIARYVVPHEHGDMKAELKNK